MPHLDFLAVINPSGSSARSIASLWWFMLAFGTITFLIVLFALLVGMRRRRDGAVDVGPPPLEPPPESAGARRWMIFGGLVLPSIAIISVFVGMLIVLRENDPRRVDADVTVAVIAHDWWWEVRYPDANVVTANEVHIPVGEKVLIALESADVIHSFWVPELAGKTDALPDRANVMLIDGQTIGRYEGKCAEFCGIQHANMGFTVVVESRADYDAWLAANAVNPAGATSTDTGGGADLFVQNCSRCHTLDGSEPAEMAAPDLPTLSERERIGGVLDNTPENLRDWISDPHAYKEGVLMPSPGLSDEQIDEIAAYVEGLRP